MAVPMEECPVGGPERGVPYGNCWLVSGQLSCYVQRPVAVLVQAFERISDESAVPSLAVDLGTLY